MFRSSRTLNASLKSPVSRERTKGARNEIYRGSNLIVFTYRSSEAGEREASSIACVFDSDQPIYVLGVSLAFLDIMLAKTNKRKTQFLNKNLDSSQYVLRRSPAAFYDIATRCTLTSREISRSDKVTSFFVYLVNETKKERMHITGSNE